MLCRICLDKSNPRNVWQMVKTMRFPPGNVSETMQIRSLSALRDLDH